MSKMNSYHYNNLKTIKTPVLVINAQHRGRVLFPDGSCFYMDFFGDIPDDQAHLFAKTILFNHKTSCFESNDLCQTASGMRSYDCINVTKKDLKNRRLRVIKLKSIFCNVYRFLGFIRTLLPNTSFRHIFYPKKN